MFELLYDLANQMNCNLFNEGDKKSFPINVTVEDGNYHVYAAIPGVNKEDIKIDFENSLLTIKTECKKEEKEENTKKYLVKERSECAYERSIRFEDFDEESISAKYENGILEVILCPKKPEVKEKKKIVIE
ncbi:MAG: Hsp20/alpha crystallin family protein [Acholeplasmatales bacterium]|nr:Hsp20/alpha crystallin family protein [Acholeplasmatales bacterium]